MLYPYRLNEETSSKDHDLGNLLQHAGRSEAVDSRKALAAARHVVEEITRGEEKSDSEARRYPRPAGRR